MSYYFIQEELTEADKKDRKKFIDLCSGLADLIKDSNPWDTVQEIIPKIDEDK